MGHSDTIWNEKGQRAGRLLAAAALIFAAAPAAVAQTAAGLPPAEWRAVGASVIDRGLASLAGGAIDRVWYSADGGRLFARLRGGRVFATDDFEAWRPVTASAPADAVEYSGAASRPAPGVRLRAAAGQTASARIYAFGGEAVYQSDDEGRSWRNVSHHRRESILGGGFADLAVSPRDAAELVVAGADGVWRSLDGGASWAGLNEGLPNLPVRKIYQAGTRLRAGLDGGQEITWGPGQRTAWLPAAAEAQRREAAARDAASAALGATVLTLAAEGDFVYAGLEGGRLAASADRGRTWRWQPLEPGFTVAAMFADPAEPRVALAAAGGRIYRTFNGGLFWDDLTGGGLPAPAGTVRALAADVASGSVYAAADGGLFASEADLRGGGVAGAWSRLPGLPADAAVWDVRFDEGGNQIFVAVDGHGVFAALAPHRFRDPRVVNAADRSRRAAAPGGLLSVIGAAVASARVGNVDAPVLSVNGGESQIQVPFEVATSLGEVSLAVVTSNGRPGRNLALTLAAASPAIFLDRDGAPMLLDADRGVLVEPGTPLRAGSRVQILATGLGRVTPDWPTGTPAPAENTPRVAASVRVVLDRVPVEVTRATLAPGFVGFYLIEAVLPETVNNGPAELYIEAAGLPSGRVSVLLAQ